MMLKLIVLFMVTIFVLAQGCMPGQPEEAVPEEEETLEVTLYFGCPEAIETGEQGKYGYVTPIFREIPHTDAVLLTAMEELVRGPEKEDLSPVVHDSVNIVGINIEEGVATIDLCQEMFGPDWWGGTLGGTIFMQSVVLTATQFETVDKVQVLVEGQYWDDSHMIWDAPIAARDLNIGTYEPEPEADVQKWVDYSRDLLLAQDRIIDNQLYILVTYGVKPTGGYSVTITDITDDHPEITDKLVVTVAFSEPEEGEPVTQAITRPYDLAVIDPVSMPIEYKAEGDREFIPVLEGIDWLPPLAASSENIKIFSPAPGDRVGRTFQVQGIEQVFEGTVVYTLLDCQGQALDSGFVTGHGYNWGYFEIEIDVPDQIQQGQDIMVEVYSESPVDGSVINLIELDLTLQNG